MIKNSFSKLLAVLAGVALSVSTVSAAGQLSARLRATYLDMANQSNAFSALGINFAADAVRVSDKLIPEIDIDYAFNQNLSLELVLTIPQEHNVSLRGVGHLGSFKHLPPTLLAQYRMNPIGKATPYVGVGVNYTLIWDDNLSVAGVPLTLENSSIGMAAQAGVDYVLSDKLSINIDVKKVAIESDVAVRANGAVLTKAELDPWLYSVGLSYKF